LPGNRLQLYSDPAATLQAIRDDIDRARSTCHLLFYIWQEGGEADQVAEALVRATRRGVVCRVLVDYVGSKEFLAGGVAARLRRSGVQVEDALEVGPLRLLFQRIDLRNHRKIVVIDGEVAYTGSMNMVDPRYFKQDAKVGLWVDAMVRVQGPAVGLLNLVFLRDWEIETEVGAEELVESGNVRFVEPAGDEVVQIVPSTPGVTDGQVIHEVLLKTIYSARRELVLTTPYFVPTDTLVHALTTAAYSGVDVTLVVPARVDSVLVRHASESTYERLLEAGVRVMLYRGGLLHSKTLTIDGQIAMIGSTNMDMRSFYINFEVTLFCYTAGFARQLRSLQKGYLEDSTELELEAWRQRSSGRRFLQNVVRLASPLL
jgi:cardiolipin synthase